MNKKKCETIKKQLSKILFYIKTNYDFKLVVFFAFSILLFGVFQEKFNSLINNTFIPLYQDIHISFFSEIILFLFVFVLLIIDIIKSITGYCENKLSLWLFITIGIIYWIFYRYNDNSYEFFRYTFFKKFAYLDVIIIKAFTSSILLKINYGASKNQKSKNKNKENPQSILEGLPWEKGDKDIFNRLGGAEKLAKEIAGLNSEKSFSYGIVGEWGSGKTSFLNMVENELKKNNNVIVVNFNPWESSSYLNIQKDFFSCLKYSLVGKSSEISPSINKYVKSFLNANKSSIIESFKNLFEEQYEFSKQFSAVNKAICKIKKKIIIIIDDIDRLEKEEILQVLKLIRNTGSFENTVFITAYDKNYINDTLKNSNNFGGNYFIEKIFQQEIILPNYPFSILSNRLIDLLKKYYKYDAKISYEIGTRLRFIPIEYNLIRGVPWSISNFSEDIFLNLRDVYRFYNSFIYSYSPIKDEVDLVDMFHLEMLKLKYYNVYDELKNKNFFKNKKEYSDYYEIDEGKYNGFCRNKNVENSGTSLDIIRHLFPKENNTKDTSMISFKKSFPLYFSNQLFNRLSRRDYNNAIADKECIIQDVVEKWIKQRFVSDVIEYTSSKSYKLLKNRNEFENYLDIYFILISKELYSSIGLFLRFFEKDAYKNDIVKKIYEGQESKFDGYIKSKICNAEYPYQIVRIIQELIYKYLYVTEYSFVLKIEELQDQAIVYLEKFLKKSSDLSNEGMTIYLSCIEKFDENNVVILPEANNLLKKFIQKNPKYYLNTFIRPSRIRSNIKTGDPFVTQIFGSNKNFEKFLDECKIYEDIETIKDFFNKFKENKYEPISWDKPKIK
ncbi:MAG: hypothetical protein IMY72_10215 [Bacteroidetes bacterium]|nr:hypothetical protein [Bacteroidota bacterium]